MGRPHSILRVARATIQVLSFSFCMWTSGPASASSIDLALTAITVERILDTDSAIVRLHRSLCTLQPITGFAYLTRLAIDDSIIKEDNDSAYTFNTVETAGVPCWEYTAPYCGNGPCRRAYDGGYSLRGHCEHNVQKDSCACVYYRQEIYRIAVPYESSTITVAVDPDGALDELDETNNTLSAQLAELEIPTISMWGALVFATLLLVSVAFRIWRSKPIQEHVR